MKKLLAAAVFALLLPIVSPDISSAQVPGSSLSVALLGGVQSSNTQSPSPDGSYIALRGSLSNYFVEGRHASWYAGNPGVDPSISDNSVLVGYHLSLWDLVVSGAVGYGTVTNQGPTQNGFTPAAQTYNSIAYEAQAVYNFPVVKHVDVGVGLNYMGEMNTTAPVSSVGVIGSVSFAP